MAVEDLSCLHPPNGTNHHNHNHHHHQQPQAHPVEQQNTILQAAMDSREGFHSIWSGFYKKALRERQNQLRLVYTHLFPSTPTALALSHTSSSSSKSQSTHTNGITNGSTNGHSYLHLHSPTGLFPSPSDSPPSTPDLPSTPEPINDTFPLNGLDEHIADNMVENCVGTLGLPVGIGLNFTINGVPTVVPMCIEEPSVIAAASGAAKTISTYGGGFTATTTDRNVTYAQIQLFNIDDDRLPSAIEQINARKADIIDLGNQFCQNMYTRGGGVVDVSVRSVERRTAPKRAREVRQEKSYNSWLVVHLHVDVCDAMGANCASSVAEGVAPFLCSLTGGTVGLRIVSNLNVERMAKASFCVPVEKLGYKGVPGEQVAFRVVEANDWARSDPYRATTHNKGIMNGIDAVALATGQDWRAVAAAGHAWNAVRSDSYRPFTDYWVQEDDNGKRYLCGELELPMPVATKGGVLRTNPVYSYTLGLLNKPDSKGLAKVMVAVGLAQNFAALRALSTEGIQRGHMSLHARNIAIAAGAPPHAIAECCTFMVETGRFTRNAVKEYLTAHEVHQEIRLNGSFDNLASMKNMAEQASTDEMPPSLFYFEQSEPTDSSGTPLAEERVTMNVAFQSLGGKPVHIELVPNVPPTKAVRQLFGEKGHAWLSELFGVLESLKLTTIKPERANVIQATKLKLLSVLLNILVRRLMEAHPVETARFIKRISRGRTASMDGQDQPSNKNMNPAIRYNTGIFRHRVLLDVDLKHMSHSASDHLLMGFPLVLAIWQVFEFRVQQWVGEPVLARALIDEQYQVVLALTDKPLLHPSPTFPAVARIHAKRFQSSVFSLCDAISFPEAIINRNLVRTMQRIGERLEHEHAVAHDVSERRLSRDIRDACERGWSDDGGLGHGPANLFLLWLKIVGGWSVDTLRKRCDPANDTTNVHAVFQSEIRDFLRDVDSKQDLQQFLEAADQWQVLDRTRLEAALSMFRKFYGVAAL